MWDVRCCRQVLRRAWGDPRDHGHAALSPHHRRAPPPPSPHSCLQPAGTEEDPAALFWDRGQFMHVLSPSRTVVVYKKVNEEEEARAAAAEAAAAAAKAAPAAVKVASVAGGPAAEAVK